MKVYEIQKGSTSLDGLRRGERPEPTPGPHQVKARVHACSLNYRDLMVARGSKKRAKKVLAGGKRLDAAPVR